MGGGGGSGALTIDVRCPVLLPSLILESRAQLKGRVTTGLTASAFEMATKQIVSPVLQVAESPSNIHKCV